MELPASDVLDRMTDAFFAVDADWRFTDLNERGCDAVCEASGRDVTVDELVGQNLWDEIPEAVDTVFQEQFTRAVETQEPITFEAFYEPLGTWFEVRAYPSESGLSVYFTDVTRRKTHEQRLEKRDGTLRAVHSVIADKSASLEEKVDELLTIGRDALGTDYGALSRVDGDDYVFEIVHDPEGETEPGDVVPLEETNCERAIVTEETLVLADVAADAPHLTDRAGFTEQGVSCYLGTPVEVDGDVYGTFCFYDREPRSEPFTDWEVTLVELLGNWVSYEQERVRRQEDLRRERNRLDEFASIVSHDLRNPLAIATGWVDMAREDCDSEHLGHAADALGRMEDIVGDVLSLARAGDGDVETGPIALEALARTAWGTVTNGRGRLVVERDATVVGDEGLLRQLLENLLANALEHCGDDVTVRVEPLPDGDGFVVEDDGPGIPEADRERVFEPGYSTRADGTGLGLEIVATIAAAHGGDVAVGEAESGGVRFEVSGL